jgi:transcriptional regulator with XRE-family HTH domain
MELKARRAAMRLTQEQAAYRLGIGLRHYQKLEAGHCAITGPLAKLAALILFKGEGE